MDFYTQKKKCYIDWIGIRVARLETAASMRISGYIDRSGQKQSLFTALQTECQLADSR